MCINKRSLVYVFVFLFLQIYSSLLWAKQAQDLAIAYLRHTNDYWQVWITDGYGKHHKQVTRDAVDKTRVSWFPDRKRLLVNGNDGTLSIVELKTGKSTHINLDALEVFDAKLSHDGLRIAYTSTTSLQADNAEVWIANIDGTEKVKLTNNTSVALTPSWNPRNNAILFSAGVPNENQEIWEVAVSNRQSQQVTIAKTTSIDPCVNQRGVLLYSSNGSGAYSIWMLGKDQKPQQITQSTGFDAQPSWAPDGKAFVFYRIADSKKQIWLKELSTNREYPITPDDVLSRSPAWIN